MKISITVYKYRNIKDLSKPGNNLLVFKTAYSFDSNSSTVWCINYEPARPKIGSINLGFTNVEIL